MRSPQPGQETLPSIRRNHLAAAVLVVAVLVFVAIIANGQVARNARRATEAVVLRDYLFTTTAEMRAALAAAEATLHRGMVGREAVDAPTINARLRRARELLDELSLRASGIREAVAAPLADLDEQLVELSSDFTTLLERSADPNWVYPMLPFVNGPLPKLNSDFVTAAGTALDDIAADGNGLVLYQRLVQLRDLWRRMILSFRSLIVRFAGLDDQSTQGLEEDIRDAQATIQDMLARLKVDVVPMKNFILDDALDRMRMDSQEWFRIFHDDIGQIRQKSEWRADIQFLDQRIRPTLDNIALALVAMEGSINTWAAGQIDAIQFAANRISLILWGIALLALVFVIVNYAVMRHSVFRPVEQVARALTAAAKEEKDVYVPERKTREIAVLVSAVNDMQAYLVERKQTEERLIEATQRAEEANKVKAQFLEKMSHELRTPLNSILGFTQILEADRKNPLRESHREGIKQIQEAGWHLLEIVNELLDLNLVEAEEVQLQMEPVALADLLQNCLDTIEPLAERHGITIRPLQASGCHVRTDPARLRQVMRILLSNAVKFNHDGGSLKVTCQQTVEGTVRVGVTDTGRGIPEDELPSIFEPFSQQYLDTYALHGTGIGLAIAKRLVEQMGGQMEVVSELGKGSTFWLELQASAPPVPD
ncbi:MAG: hypothetical protein LJE84_11400 [Gammaproteobacteria bacterium]|nr:hypothetical protein [Gammaproteobacteria bacterium]